MKSDCIVLSFGVNNNDNFEREITEKLDCTVHMFDPFIEPLDVKIIRQRNKINENKISIKMIEEKKWYFHSIGITNKERIKNENKIGW